MSDTIEIPGYAYKVTKFGNYNEASDAVTIAMLEDEAIASTAVEYYNGGYLASCFKSGGYYYL